MRGRAMRLKNGQVLLWNVRAGFTNFVDENYVISGCVTAEEVRRLFDDTFVHTGYDMLAYQMFKLPRGTKDIVLLKPSVLDDMARAHATQRLLNGGQISRELRYISSLPCEETMRVSTDVDDWLAFYRQI